MDLKRFKQDYDKYSFQQKKETVLKMLESLLGKGDNFDNIYHFILEYPNEVLQNELDEVFGILILSIYKDSQGKIKSADQKLENIRNKMLQVKKQEYKERQENDADVFLEEAFAMI
ncbi:MAG: hypothetical protein PHE25_03710 [Candidatus Gracilibacteria bacterium]|nr:hypothetical protein [Candidatus Gracilibacteria bacterium]